MGDHVHITPETPGRPSIRNPFESPNDYHHLREPVVPSPSVFKSKTCKATPPKFTWSIEEMASLFPVHIDQEEILRQSFYLSQTRTDSDIEQKCQNAIDHFFTKGSIVPSPWAAPESCRAGPCCKKSTVSPLITENQGKTSVGCQTTLSLPLTFDLEKVLGEYYRYEEPCETVQESLSTSSLRRKLFLDGQGSGSDSSTPPSPVRGLSEHSKLQADGTDGAAGDLHVPKSQTTFSVSSSPLSCGIQSTTPSTGQFSSSPIQNGRFRDCSLGSMNSPVLPDRSSPAHLTSPIISPISTQVFDTPSASKSKATNLTPLNVPMDGDVTSGLESPFVEGCSPIQSCSPHQLNYHESKNYSRLKLRNRVGFWASPPPISPILNPKLQDGQELDDLHPLPSMEMDSVSPQTAGLKHTEAIHENSLKPLAMEEAIGKDNEGRLGDEQHECEEPVVRLTSSCMGNVTAGEGSQMFMSLLTEGSSIRYESSMQVDSGYNTTSAGTGSFIDGLGSECNSKESFSAHMSEDAFQFTRHTKPKISYPYN